MLFNISIDTDGEYFEYTSTAPTAADAASNVFGLTFFASLKRNEMFDTGNASDRQWYTEDMDKIITATTDEVREAAPVCTHCGGQVEEREINLLHLTKARYRMECVDCYREYFTPEEEAERKAAQEQARKESAERDARIAALDLESVSVGDIFCYSWGYSMTLVNFYQVVELTKSGKSCKVREVAQKTVSGDAGYQGKVVAIKDQYIAETSGLKRLKFSKGYPTLFNEDHGRAYKWNGEPMNFNKMD